MKAIVGLLLYVGYKVQHHYLFRISLRNWLWVLLVAPPGAAFLRLHLRSLSRFGCFFHLYPWETMIG